MPLPELDRVKSSFQNLLAKAKSLLPGVASRAAVESAHRQVKELAQQQQAAVRELKDSIDRLQGDIETLQASASAGRSEAALAARRSLAELKLWAQLDRMPGLDLSRPARSVIFTRHSYYHFFYLAEALRRRGWRALCVSFEDPNGINSQYYHREDVNMWDADPAQLRVNVEVTYEFAKAHFDLMHFAGDRCLSFFPWSFGEDDPQDIIEWKRLGKHVAYTVSGCNSATSQSSVARWSSASTGGDSMCQHCVWQVRPGACTDQASLHWGEVMHRYCDLVFSELQPSLDHLSARHPNVVRGPHTAVLDAELWSPQLEIPEPFRVARAPGEVLIYHAFGNFRERHEGERNIKGSPAIFAAVERLRAEGIAVRLLFFSRVPNELVRLYQAQADIVVDQLWAGSWGANGRESLMLGKPVVGFVSRYEDNPADLLQAIEETPVVNATEQTVYDVLKELVLDPQRRRELGERSRQYALKWHAADAGAQRYEQAYDRMIARQIEMETPFQ